MEEKYNLSWKDFETYALDTFRLLNCQEEFSDVTLVCDGDNQIKAHKVILSACSPFFRNILLKNPHPNPLLYLGGVTFKNIKALVCFMYTGQAEVAHDDLNAFMKAGLDLGIKGLAENKTVCEEDIGASNLKQTHKNPKEEILHVYEDGALESQNSENIVDTYDLALVERALVDDSYDPASDGKFQCEHCNYATKYKQNLKKHIKSIHECVKYPCNSCDYKATEVNKLDKHMRTHRTVY